MAHLVIRDPSFVAGTTEKPEVKLFVQTHSTRSPVSENRLAPGQIVWMKWVSGPIVARSKILSWHLGKFENSNINQLRELCIGSSLFGLNEYWKHVAQKVNAFYAVIHLCDEEWLDNPIYTGAFSRNSWVYLDTPEKHLQWLSHQPQKAIDDQTQKGRSIPKGLRFEVLRRDNFTCTYCGQKAPDVMLEVDHIMPWSIVKEHKKENLTTACKGCNIGKSNKIIKRVE